MSENKEEKTETKRIKIQETKQDRCEKCGELMFRGEEHACKTWRVWYWLSTHVSMVQSNDTAPNAKPITTAARVAPARKCKPVCIGYAIAWQFQSHFHGRSWNFDYSKHSLANLRWCSAAKLNESATPFRLGHQSFCSGFEVTFLAHSNWWATKRQTIKDNAIST